MDLTRTTIRIPPQLKRAAQEQALEEGISFQDLVNQTLRIYIQNKTVKKAKKIVFPTHDLGVPLDNLIREDFYAD